MADEIIGVAHDLDDNSYTFNYRFEGQVTRLVNVLKGEAASLDDAKALADQRAADLKQEWQDDRALLDSVIGPVVLPQAKAKIAVPATSDVLDA